MALFKIVVWAMIFLTKLRFPPGISIATVLKNQLCYNLSFADLLQLVETICSKPVDNKHWQSPFQCAPIGEI